MITKRKNLINLALISLDRNKDSMVNSQSLIYIKELG